MKKLLELRKKLNAKRPRFTQAVHHKRKRLSSTRWRKPKGMHGKQRHQFHGKPANVKPGYRGPKAVRGLSRKGLEQVLIHNPAQLASIEPKTQAVIIGRIGDKKRAAILAQCAEKNITILNVKDINDKIKAITERIEQRKKAKTDAKKKRDDKKAKAKKQQKEEKQDPEEVKKEQQEEMEQIVTGK